MADSFLAKVVHMLGSDNEELIHWNNAGDAIVIVDSNRFARELLPKYFKTKKFNSFVRQLNFYGFRKVPTSKTAKGCEFAHRLFKRGCEEKIMSIKRKTIHEMDCDQFDFMAEDQQMEEENYTQQPQKRHYVDERDKTIELLKERCKKLEKENEELKRIASSCGNHNCDCELNNNNNNNNSIDDDYYYNSQNYGIDDSNFLERYFGNYKYDDDEFDPMI